MHVGDLKDFEQRQRAELRERLSDDDLRWLERSITWEAPDLRDISGQLLRQLFPEPNHPERINDNRLLLTLIWQWWLLILMGSADPVRGNLRSFWYQVVEPFYREHRLLAPTEGFVELVGTFPTEVGDLPTGVSDRANRAARVVELMTENIGKFVWHRIFKFSGEFEFQRPMDHLSFVGKDDAKYLFFTEKEGLWWLCEMLYGEPEKSISVMAANGQPSFLSLEYYARDLTRRTKKVWIGVFSDYDPWGWAIAINLADKLRFLGLNKVEAYYLTSPELFTPQQIANGHDLSHHPQQSQVRHWVEDTGGVEGRPIALHIDVLSRSKKELVAHDFVKHAYSGKLGQHYLAVPKLDDAKFWLAQMGVS